MAPLVEGEAVLQGLVHDGLHAVVHRRANRDPPLEQVLDSEAGPAVLAQLGEDLLDRGGGVGLALAVARHADRLGLADPGDGLGYVSVARHQGQDLVAAAQRPRIAGRRDVVPGRLADARQQRRLARVRDRVARQGLAEVVLGGGGQAVAAVAHVVEAGGAREDLALGLLLRSVAPAHLLLEPQRQAHLLQLSEQLVRGRHTDDGGENPLGPAVVEEGVSLLLTRPRPQEVGAHELLSERRAALRQQQAEPGTVPPGAQRPDGRPADDPRQRGVVDAGVGEEVLVFGRQNGLSQDGGHLVVRRPPGGTRAPARSGPCPGRRRPRRSWAARSAGRARCPAGRCGRSTRGRRPTSAGARTAPREWRPTGGRSGATTRTAAAAPRGRSSRAGEPQRRWRRRKPA